MRRILLIEDDTLLRETAASFLREEGFAVLTAANGIEGVEMAMEHLPDLILCDIAMPRMNGYDVYRIISESSATAFIPVIFLSARAEREDVRMGMQLGADDYITKPFDFDELIKAINLRIAKRERLVESNCDAYKTLIESSISGVFMLQEDQITFANGKLARLLGCSREQLVGRSLLDFVHEGDREAVEERVRRCVKGIQSHVSIQFRGLAMNGHCPQLDLWGGITRLNGKPLLVGNIISMDEYNRMATAPEPTCHSTGPVAPPALNPPLPPLNKDNLSDREVEVLRLICQGYTNPEIAQRLFLSVRTVDSHRSNLLGKTGAGNTAELVVYAVRHGFFEI